MTNPDPDTSSPAIAYAHAPSVISEIRWVIAQSTNRAPNDHAEDRVFWLRKAALLDRIALNDDAAEVREAATNSARRLVEYDRDHGRLGHREQGLVTDEDRRAYVREQYHAWRHLPHV